MKTVSKLLALVLAITMIATFTAACGDKKDDAKTTAGSGGSGSDSTSVDGAAETWGDLSIFVPSSMEMKGGDGTFDPDDPKTAWLYDKENQRNYIKVSIIADENNAKESIATTTSVNEKYNPASVALTAGSEWKGVYYNANGTDVASLYSVAGDKVYLVMMGGFKFDSDVVKAVLESLK